MTKKKGIVCGRGIKVMGASKGNGQWLWASVITHVYENATLQPGSGGGARL